MADCLELAEWQIISILKLTLRKSDMEYIIMNSNFCIKINLQLTGS